MSKPKITVVEWEDPCSAYNWMGLKEFRKFKPAQIISCGLLIHEDEDYIRLAMDYDKAGGVNTGGVIPKRLITKRKDLELPRGVWSKKDQPDVQPNYPVMEIT